MCLSRGKVGHRARREDLDVGGLKTREERVLFGSAEAGGIV